MATLTPEQEKIMKEADAKSAATTAIAEASKKNTGVSVPVVSDGSALSPRTEVWSKLVQPLSFGVLLYGVLVLAMTVLLIYNKRIKVPVGDSQWLIRVLVIPMCVICAVFLTVVGYNTQEMSPAIGLLGTIVGYLLGAATKPQTPNGAPPPDDEEAEREKIDKRNAAQDEAKKKGGG